MTPQFERLVPTSEAPRRDLDLLGEITGGGDYTRLLQETFEPEAFGVKFHCLSLKGLIRVKTAAGRQGAHTRMMRLPARQPDPRERPPGRPAESLSAGFPETPVGTKAAGADLGVLPHHHVSKHLGAGVKQDPGPDLRMTIARLLSSPSEGDFMENGNGVMDDRRFTDHEAGAMVYEYSRTDPGSRRDVHRHSFGEEMLDIGRRDGLTLAPEMVGNPVSLEGMETLVEEESRQTGPGNPARKRPTSAFRKDVLCFSLPAASSASRRTPFQSEIKGSPSI